MCRNTIQGERFRPQESKQRATENIAFRHAIQSSNNLKKIKWHHIENQPLPREIYKEKPIISYKKGKSLKDILVRAKLKKKGQDTQHHDATGVQASSINI